MKDEVAAHVAAIKATMPESGKDMPDWASAAMIVIGGLIYERTMSAVPAGSSRSEIILVAGAGLASAYTGMCESVVKRMGAH